MCMVGCSQSSFDMDDEQDGTIAVMSDGEILESSQETSTALQMLIDDLSHV